MTMSAIQRLLSLKVTDVMTRSVATVAAHQPMSEVADVLAANSISGVPVVDEKGSCVGMISAVDFVGRETAIHKGERPPLGMERHELSQSERDKPLDIVGAPKDVAQTYMSRSVQSVMSGASLMEAARIMNAQHVHRLPVLDSDGCPVGLLTSTDVVAALINAIDEMKQASGAGS